MEDVEAAEARLGEKITEAVITVPAYFNDSQRQATRDAGKIAGLEVKRIINEPTAAALAYGFNKKKNEKIAVFDFGGGTFDISILEVADDVIEVKSTDGDAHLGGRDIDQKILHWIADQFQKENGIDLRKDPLALQRLDEAAEKAKIELSTAVQTEINIPFITSGSDGPKHLLITMTRAKLEEITQEFIDRAIEITKRAMGASPFKVNELNEVILVGGQTRMPAMQNAVKQFFGRDPHMGVNPDEVVAADVGVLDRGDDADAQGHQTHDLGRDRSRLAWRFHLLSSRKPHRNPAHPALVRDDVDRKRDVSLLPRQSVFVGAGKERQAEGVVAGIVAKKDCGEFGGF
jgi:molecular chaperone DnaK